MDKTDKTLGDRIVYRGRLPLMWTSAQAEPTQADLATMNETNATLLKVFLALDEMPTESADGNSELQQAYFRLDAKLNLLLDLIGEMLTRQKALPAVHDFALSELGLVWFEKNAQTRPAEGGENAYVELYLKPDFPRPVRFFTRLGIKAASDQGVQLAGRFSGMSEEVRDALAKLIFRQHRRMVANRHGTDS
ncbi:PilZ domain-containing protein [Acidihalobacter ferrooxydans]|uniref:Cyclic di-GMP receptor atypical PilZ domain-containing protein n=1 Tax=Acidihalobacter ferrooxydans TaxID=1765967 RepID=A0A1P8UGP9_9GAMM|nr:PilZ domain-containing protein [Acidihalobacter ferrooxydans]APZ42999.1 hypothetical protein BW247_07755 [Acidihalobacter ferrooxydans]